MGPTHPVPAEQDQIQNPETLIRNREVTSQRSSFNQMSLPINISRSPDPFITVLHCASPGDCWLLHFNGLQLTYNRQTLVKSIFIHIERSFIESYDFKDGRAF